MSDDDELMCKHCGGLIAIRNPSGGCDHLFWPDNLTDDAKRANGFVPVQQIAWVKSDTGMAKRCPPKIVE